jgi:hypothetical protein
VPHSESKLEDQKRGELRWSSRDQVQEILIPSVVLKYANSSLSGSKPIRLILPDLGHHRTRLIDEAADPGKFFVKTAKMMSTRARWRFRHAVPTPSDITCPVPQDCCLNLDKQSQWRGVVLLLTNVGSDDHPAKSRDCRCHTPVVCLSK